MRGCRYDAVDDIAGNFEVCRLPVERSKVQTSSSLRRRPRGRAHLNTAPLSRTVALVLEDNVDDLLENEE